MSNKPKELVVYINNSVFMDFLNNMPILITWKSYPIWIKSKKLQTGDSSVVTSDVYDLMRYLHEGCKELKKVGAILPNESVICGINHLHDRILTSSDIKWYTGGGPAACLNKLGYSIRNSANKFPRTTTEIHHRVLAPAFALIYLHISDMRQSGSYSSLRLVDYKEDRGVSTVRYRNYKSILTYINNSVEDSPLRKIAESKAFIDTYDGLETPSKGPAKKRAKTSSSSSTGPSSSGIPSPKANNIKVKHSNNDREMYDLTTDMDDDVIRTTTTTTTSITPPVKVVNSSRTNTKGIANNIVDILGNISNDINIVKSMLSIQNLNQRTVSDSVSKVIKRLKLNNMYKFLHDGATYLATLNGEELQTESAKYENLLQFLIAALESHSAKGTAALQLYRFLVLSCRIIPCGKDVLHDYTDVLSSSCYKPSLDVKDVVMHKNVHDLVLVRLYDYIFYCVRNNTKRVLSEYIKYCVSGLVELAFEVYKEVVLLSRDDRSEYTPFSLYLTIEVFARVYTTLKKYVGEKETKILRDMFRNKYGMRELVGKFGKLENLITYPAVYIRVLTFCNSYPQYIHTSLEKYLAIAKGMMRLSDDRKKSSDIKSIEETAISIPLTITNYKLINDLKPENDVTKTTLFRKGSQYIKRYNVYIDYCRLFVECITRLIKIYERKPSKYIDNMNATISVIVTAYNTIGSDPSRIYYEPVTTGETTLYKDHLYFGVARQKLVTIKQSLSELEDAGFKTYSKLTIDGNSVKFVIEGNNHSSPSVDIPTPITAVPSSTSSSSSSGTSSSKSTTFHVTHKASSAKKRITPSVTPLDTNPSSVSQNDFTLWFTRMKNSKVIMAHVEKAVDIIIKDLKKKDPFLLKELYFDSYPTHLLAYQILYSNSPTVNNGGKSFNGKFIKDNAKRLLMANFTTERLQSLRNRHIRMIFTSFYNRLQESKEEVNKALKDQAFGTGVRYVSADDVQQKSLGIPINVVTGQTIRDYAAAHVASERRKVVTESDRKYAEFVVLDSYTALIYTNLFVKGTKTSPRLVYNQRNVDNTVLKYTADMYTSAIALEHNATHDIGTREKSEIPDTVGLLVHRMLRKKIPAEHYSTVINNYNKMKDAKLDSVDTKIFKEDRPDNSGTITFEKAQDIANGIVSHVLANLQSLKIVKSKKSKAAQAIPAEENLEESDSESDDDEDDDGSIDGFIVDTPGGP